MSENSTSNSDGSDLEARRLACMSDADIDTSDIPEVRDWSQAERGRFYRPEAAHRIPVYLDNSVRKALSALALEKGQEVDALVNEWLKRDIENARGSA